MGEDAFAQFDELALKGLEVGRGVFLVASDGSLFRRFLLRSVRLALSLFHLQGNRHRERDVLFGTDVRPDFLD